MGCVSIFLLFLDLRIKVLGFIARWVLCVFFLFLDLGIKVFGFIVYECLSLITLVVQVLGFIDTWRFTTSHASVGECLS